MQTLKTRNQLVDKILDKIKKEYEEISDEYFKNLKNINNKSEMTDFANVIMYLQWVKKYIIDDNAQMFRAFRRGITKTEFEFYVDDDVINLIISRKDEIFIKHLYYRLFLNDYDWSTHMTHQTFEIFDLRTITEENIGTLLYDPIDFL